MSDTTLLVANDGGHIMQLATLAPRLGLDDVVWATVPTPQTESLLEGERVEWTEPAPTRDTKAVMRNAALMRKVIKKYSPERIVSTGASLALSALPLGAIHGVPTHYIESVTRAEDFSVSGRALRRIPSVRTYTQWPHLADENWHYKGSVLDGFSVHNGGQSTVDRIVVSVGTSQTFGFRRLLARLVDVIPSGVEVLWQTGSTDTAGLPIDARPSVPGDDLAQAIADADVLISHAGAGISLSGITNGKMPLIVARQAERHEHVDDHQEQIARHLGERGLAMVCTVDDLTWDDVERAGRHTATRDPNVEPFRLD